MSVSVFTNDFGKKIMVDLVHAAATYGCEYRGETYLMIIWNELYMQYISITILSLLKARLSKIKVDKFPKFLSDAPIANNNSIYFREHDLILPLKLGGIISYMPCWMKGEKNVPTKANAKSDFNNISMEPTIYHISVTVGVNGRLHRSIE